MNPMITQTFTFAALALLAQASFAAPITGTGSTIAAPVINAWAKKDAAQLTYEATGSSAGVEAATIRKSDFGATDRALIFPELEAKKLSQVPIIASGITALVNLPGVTELRLTGMQLGQIYLGQITKWNDKSIASNNVGVTLPNLDIKVAYRSDGSGTTYAFTGYISKSSDAWRRKYGRQNSLAFPTGTGQQGTAGMMDYVKATKGAIGYAVLSTNNQGLLLPALENADRVFVKPTIEGVAAALSKASWSDTTNSADLLLAPGADSWPITTATYVLIPLESKARPDVNRFISNGLSAGAAQVSAAGMVPLPQTLVSKLQSILK
jgi:phosphate transport system substrate-binding protein